MIQLVSEKLGFVECRSICRDTEGRQRIPSLACLFHHCGKAECDKFGYPFEYLIHDMEQQDTVLAAALRTAPCQHIVAFGIEEEIVDFPGRQFTDLIQLRREPGRKQSVLRGLLYHSQCQTTLVCSGYRLLKYEIAGIQSSAVEHLIDPSPGHFIIPAGFHVYQYRAILCRQ